MYYTIIIYVHTSLKFVIYVKLFFVALKNVVVVHKNTLSDLLAKSLKMSGRGPDSVDSLRSLATCLAVGQSSISFELAREAPSFSYNCGAVASRTILKHRFFHSLITDFCTRDHRPLPLSHVVNRYY